MSAVSANLDEDWVYSSRPHGDSTLGLIVTAAFSAVSFVVALLALPFLLPISLMFRFARFLFSCSLSIDCPGQMLSKRGRTFSDVCFLIFRLWRNYLDNKVMLEVRGEAEICAGDDAVWLQDSHENRAIITSLFELGGDVEIDKFRDVIGIQRRRKIFHVKLCTVLWNTDPESFL